MIYIDPSSDDLDHYMREAEACRAAISSLQLQVDGPDREGELALLRDWLARYEREIERLGGIDVGTGAPPAV